MSAESPKPLAAGHPTLIPVVELEPTVFGTIARRSPGGSARDLPDEWRTYWKASVADRGLSLEPLPLPGSWSVPLDALTDERALVTVAKLAGGLECGAEANPVESLRVLPGGYALGDGDAFFWHAACCSSLSDLSEWIALLTTPPQTRLLGHTWVRSASQGHDVVLGLMGEYELVESQIFVVETQRIPSMLADARSRVDRFRERLYEALRDHVPEESRRAIDDDLTQTA